MSVHDEDGNLQEVGRPLTPSEDLPSESSIFTFFPPSPCVFVQRKPSTPGLATRGSLSTSLWCITRSSSPAGTRPSRYGSVTCRAPAFVEEPWLMQNQQSLSTRRCWGWLGTGKMLCCHRALPCRWPLP